jgi:hypothetical protein
LAALGDGWTKSLKNIPEFSYLKLVERLVLDAKKTPDNKPAEAFKHKKVDTDFLRPVIRGRFVMASRSKTSIFLHVLKEEQRGVMDI